MMLWRRSPGFISGIQAVGSTFSQLSRGLPGFTKYFWASIWVLALHPFGSTGLLLHPVLSGLHLCLVYSSHRHCLGLIGLWCHAGLSAFRLCKESPRLTASPRSVSLKAPPKSIRVPTYLLPPLFSPWCSLQKASVIPYPSSVPLVPRPPPNTSPSTFEMSVMVQGCARICIVGGGLLAGLCNVSWCFYSSSCVSFQFSSLSHLCLVQFSGHKYSIFFVHLFAVLIMCLMWNVIFLKGG